MVTSVLETTSLKPGNKEEKLALSLDYAQTQCTNLLCKLNYHDCY